MGAGNFCILDSLRLLLVHSQVLENDQKRSQVITVSDAFSGAIWAKCTINNNNHSIVSHLTGVQC